MKNHRHIANLLGLVVIGVSVSFITTSDTWAQDKHPISWTSPAGSSRYTQQHVIDVGDVPGHQVRIFELYTGPSASAPSFDGAKVVESWTRGMTDYTNLNGPGFIYGHYVLSDGNKIYWRLNGLAQSTANADGSRRTTFTGVITLTGGTGKFKSVRGTIRAAGVFDPSRQGSNETEFSGEYWMEE
jgi:hypothetical protein